MKKKSFHQLLLEAWQVSRSSRLWKFGGLVALSILLHNHVMAQEIPELDQVTWSNFFQETNFSALGLPLFLIALLFLFRFFGTSNLVALLGQNTAQKTMPRSLTPTTLWENWFRMLSLEGMLFVFLLLLLLVFALPPFVAYQFKPAVLESLILFSGSAFFIVALFTFFVEEFALFYRVISRLSLRGSLEAGYQILVKNLWRTLAFGLYSFALLVLFTFFLDLIILALGEWFGQSLILSWVVSAFFLTWFSVLYQALWFFFFRELASPPAPPEEKNKVLVPDNVPETPSV